MRDETSMTTEATMPAHVDRAFLATVLEDLQDEVFIYDVESLGLHYMNRAARHRFGWNAETVSTKRITDTAAAFDVAAFKRHVSKLIDGSEDVVSIEVTHALGPVEISTRLIKGENDTCAFLSVLRDLSWRRKAEAEELKAISTVSHELRTPLASIHGALRLLKSGVTGQLDEATHSIIDIASRNTDRLGSMVDDLLDFEKIKSNEMDFSRSEMDLVRSACEAVELLGSFAHEHNVHVELETGLSRAIVLGNADRVQQVLTNLISNAVKYSPTGGTAMVKVAMVGDRLRVSVADRGPGITRDQQALLFQPFTQARAADGSKRNGTGLGLAITAATLRRLDYPTGLDSVPGEGSTFYFDIPPAAIVRLEAGPARTTGAA